MRVLLACFIAGLGLSGWQDSYAVVGYPCHQDVRLDMVDTKRARARHVGVIMALLAAFDEAHVLPPEHDPQANQLIHTFIQLQSAVLKSPSPAVIQFVQAALDSKGVACDGAAQACLRETGLTMTTLEALIDYGDLQSPWEQRLVAEGFQAYNVQPSDWQLVRELVQSARTQLAARGKTLEGVFAGRWPAMPSRSLVKPQETL